MPDFTNKQNTSLKGRARDIVSKTYIIPEVRPEKMRLKDAFRNKIWAERADYDVNAMFNDKLNTKEASETPDTQVMKNYLANKLHGTDKYKKSNHPTFSTQSSRHIPIIRPGGKWSNVDGVDYFKARRRNVKNMIYSDGSPEAYMDRAEDRNGDGKSDTVLTYTRGARKYLDKLKK